jgi:Secretion system C-terminal sorting domain/Cleaved Adhesin Domain
MTSVFKISALALVVLFIVASATAQQKTAGKEIGTAGIAPIKAQVVADPPSVIFQEGFNDTSATGFPPAGWTFINADGNTSTDPSDTAWYQTLSVGGTYALPPYEGVACAADYYGGANANNVIDDYLITPNTGGTAPVGTVDSLVFYSVSRLSSSGEYADSLDIRVSTTDTKAASFAQRLDYILVPKTAWTRYAYLLPAAATRYIAFRYLMYDGGKSGANSDKVCIDDVQIIRYTATGVAEPKNTIPVGFALNQNYPNPFNPNTTIEFQLSKASATTLSVLNMLGQEVATLVRADLAPGRYNVRLDGTKLASGIYFYRLSAGSFTETKRMILLK